MRRLSTNCFNVVRVREIGFPTNRTASAGRSRPPFAAARGDNGFQLAGGASPDGGTARFGVDADGFREELLALVRAVVSQGARANVR